MPEAENDPAVAAAKQALEAYGSGSVNTELTLQNFEAARVEAHVTQFVTVTSSSSTKFTLMLLKLQVTTTMKMQLELNLEMQ